MAFSVFIGPALIWAIDIPLFIHTIYQSRNHRQRGWPKTIQEIIICILLAIYGWNLKQFLADELFADAIFSWAVAIGYTMSLTVLVGFIMPQIARPLMSKRHEIKHRKRASPPIQEAQTPPLNSGSVSEGKNLSPTSRFSPLKRELHRKILHLVFFGIYCAIYFFIGYLINVNTDPGTIKIGVISLIYYVGTGMVGLFLIVGDMLRIYSPNLLPDIAHRLYQRGIKGEREADTVISSVPFLFGIMFWAPPRFLPLISLVACWNVSIADGAASIVGRLVGTHNIILKGKKTPKTWEGWVAGTGVAILGPCFFFAAQLVPSFPVWGVFVLMAASGVVVGLIDLFIWRFDDNLALPLLSGFITWLWVLVWQVQ